MQTTLLLKPVVETSSRTKMAKVTIELDQGDLMELLDMLTEINDTLARIEKLLQGERDGESGRDTRKGS